MSDESQPDAATDTTADESQPGAENVDTEGAENSPPDEPAADADSFPRSYVESLRKESASYRDKAKTADERADTLAKQLHTELVRATGRLHDVRDLPFDPAHLDSPEALSGAIDELLSDKPHLKARTVTGDIGQGRRGGDAGEVKLLSLLRGKR